jgi:hypothetical protein
MDPCHNQHLVIVVLPLPAEALLIPKGCPTLEIQLGTPQQLLMSSSNLNPRHWLADTTAIRYELPV